MPRVAQISDLHLQSTVPARQAQVELILQAINDAKPDLTVVSGDITDDGWDSIDELRWAKQWLDERIEGEWYAVPGNHDVGNFATMELGPVTDEKVKAWESVFSEQSFFQYDYYFAKNPPFSGWHVQFINSMVLGSNLNAERQQFKQLTELFEYCKLNDIPIILFTHSPLLIDRITEPADPATDYWLGMPGPRHDLWAKLKQCQIKLIASGHVHQTRLATLGDTHIAWAPPASGTWVHAPGLPNPPMPEETGFLIHHLGDDGSVRTELVNCAPMLKLYHHNP